MLLGLAAIIGAVTSSFSASLLSGGAMISWNIYRPLMAGRASLPRLKHVIRLSILGLGLVAIVLALEVRSVAALWLFTADLVFVLLFPQLVMALYDGKTNRIGSMAGFAISLGLRLGGGMSVETDVGLKGFPALIRFPELFAPWLPGSPADWYDGLGATLFPIKTLAAVAGLIAIPLVSRLTGRWCPPKAPRRS
jgi:high affinity choline transporter 7